MNRAVLFVSSAFLSMIITFAVADTHYVNVNNPSPSEPYTNWASASIDIQSAIDEASEGDTVLVTNGTYDTGSKIAPGHVLSKTRVVIDKPIRVESVNGKEETFIVGEGPRGENAIRGVWMTNDSYLVGFTVTNGATTRLDMPDDDGGGVYCVSSNCFVKKCDVVDSMASDGGGVYGGAYTNCNINGNFASNYGGGVFLREGSRLTECIVFNNIADHHGGGIYCTTENCYVSACQILHNDSHYYGGGVFGRFIFIEQSTIVGNTSTFGGGGAYIYQDSVLQGCTVSSNSVPDYDGGGVWISKGTIRNCVVSSNDAEAGGGVYSCDSGIIANCAISNNYASEDGGGVYNKGTMNDCTVVFNVATNESWEHGMGGACTTGKGL